jgi:hypothetical protein
MSYTIEQVRQKLSTDQRWVERAIVKLFERQTSDEQRTDQTRVTNHRGFTHGDARRLSKAAKWIQSGRPLSGFHLQHAFKSVPKYARQVLEMIEEATPEPTTPVIELPQLQFQSQQV